MDFISASRRLAQEPCLPGAARVKRALHTYAGATNCAADPNTFQLLMVHHPGTLRLVLVPSCKVVQSDWLVDTIVTAHLHAGALFVANGFASASTPENPDADHHADDPGEGQWPRHSQAHPRPISPQR